MEACCLAHVPRKLECAEWSLHLTCIRLKGPTTTVPLIPGDGRKCSAGRLVFLSPSVSLKVIFHHVFLLIISKSELEIRRIKFFVYHSSNLASIIEHVRINLYLPICGVLATPWSCAVFLVSLIGSGYVAKQ